MEPRVGHQTLVIQMDGDLGMPLDSGYGLNRDSPGHSLYP